MKYNYKTDSTLKKIRETILSAVSPEKIILFGSRARGEIDEKSDYDILIIMSSGENERQITRLINYRLLDENIDSQIDILATSTDKWNKNKDNIAFIYKNIAREGVILYE